MRRSDRRQSSPRHRVARPLAGALLLAAVAGLSAACSERRTQLEPNPLMQALQRKAGRIAFVGPDGNIYTVDQSGGREAALTEDAGRSTDSRTATSYLQPTWSPDGRWVAFARASFTTNESFSTAILVASRDGRRTQLVLDSDRLRPIYLYWSPDSSKITLLSQPVGEVQLEIGLIDVDSATYVELDKGQPYYWSWLPDNSALLTHVGGDGRMNHAARLSLVPVDPQLERSEFNIVPTGFQAPAVSPDGRRMVYVGSSAAGGGSAAGSGSRLVARDLQGTDEQVLTEIPGYAYFSFAPDGASVAVLQTASPQPSPDGRLTIITMRGGARVTLPDSDIIAYFWSPDSRRIAYLVPARPDDDRGLAIEPLFARSSELLYLELRVAEVRRGTSWRVAQYPITQTFLTSHLPFFDQYERSATIWSPNSRFLAYTAVTSGGFPGIFVSAASGTLKPQFVTAGDFAFWSHR